MDWRCPMMNRERRLSKCLIVDCLRELYWRWFYWRWLWWSLSSRSRIDVWSWLVMGWLTTFLRAKLLSFWEAFYLVCTKSITMHLNIVEHTSMFLKGWECLEWFCDNSYHSFCDFGFVSLFVFSKRKYDFLNHLDLFASHMWWVVE